MNVAEIIRAAGGPARIAKALRRHHASVLGWRRVPAEHARTVARLAGLDPSEVRPDLYDPPLKPPRPRAELDSADAPKPPGVAA